MFIMYRAISPHLGEIFIGIILSENESPHRGEIFVGIKRENESPHGGVIFVGIILSES